MLLLHIVVFLKVFKNFCLFSKCLSIALAALLATVFIATSLANLPAILPTTLTAATLTGMAGKGMVEGVWFNQGMVGLCS